MMGALDTVFGLDRDISDVTILQMAARTVVVFLVTLLLLRVGSRRFLGKASAFDVLVAIVLGSVMSRAINGSAAFLPTLASGFVLVGLHWLFATVAYGTRWFGPLVKGEPILVIRDGRIDQDGARRAHLSRHDLEEAIRLRGHAGGIEGVAEAYLERNGRISILAKRDDPPDADG